MNIREEETVNLEKIVNQFMKNYVSQAKYFLYTYFDIFFSNIIHYILNYNLLVICIMTIYYFFFLS